MKYIVYTIYMLWYIILLSANLQYINALAWLMLVLPSAYSIFLNNKETLYKYRFNTEQAVSLSIISLYTCLENIGIYHIFI